VTAAASEKEASLISKKKQPELRCVNYGIEFSVISEHDHWLAFILSTSISFMPKQPTLPSLRVVTSESAIATCPGAKKMLLDVLAICHFEIYQALAPGIEYDMLHRFTCFMYIMIFRASTYFMLNHVLEVGHY